MYHSLMSLYEEISEKVEKKRKKNSHGCPQSHVESPLSFRPPWQELKGTSKISKMNIEPQGQIENIANLTRCSYKFSFV